MNCYCNFIAFQKRSFCPSFLKKNFHFLSFLMKSLLRQSYETERSSAHLNFLMGQLRERFCLLNFLVAG